MKYNFWFRLLRHRFMVEKLSHLFFGCHIGGPKNDLMMEIFLGKFVFIIDFTLPSNRNWMDYYDKKAEEELLEDFISETKVSSENADKV